MPTIQSPATYANTVSGLGESFIYIGNALDFELAELLDVESQQLIVPAGDVAGTGSKTMRKRYIGGLGAAQRMTSMGTETEAIVEGSFTTGYDDLTIGRHGIAHGQGFMREIIESDGVDLDFIASSYAQSYVATMRYLWAVAGSTFSTDKGPNSSAADLTDLAELVAGFEGTRGAGGRINFVISPGTLTDFRAAWASYTGAPPPQPTDTVQALMGDQGAQFVGNWWGLSVYKSHDVYTAGGVHSNFAYMEGALAYGVGSTARVRVAPGAEYARIPERGMIITSSTNGAQALNGRQCNAFFGVGKAAAAKKAQFLFTCTPA